MDNVHAVILNKNSEPYIESRSSFWINLVRKGCLASFTTCIQLLTSVQVTWGQTVSWQSFSLHVQQNDNWEHFVMWNLYEIIHIWTAVVDESEEWSLQLIFQFKQLERRSLKKSGLQQDSNPWPPRYRCDALPTELWSHTLGARSIYWVHIFPWGVKWCEIYMK